ncbi:MAG: S41 family peptidase [Clostridiales bacterium]|nr:S41 family peptidase [Clostridiales bacterium]
MKKKLIALLLICCMIVPSFGVFAEDETVDLQKIDEILQYIDFYYKEDVSREELIEGAYKGILDTLDKHSTYFTQKEYQTFLDGLDGTLIGIGVYIEEENKMIKVISPIEGSPAFKAGLKSGDLITHVDGQDVTKISFEEGIDMIKGEAGTTVKIQILRAGKVLNFDIVREVITIPDVSFEMLEDHVGYLKIIQFGDGVAAEVAVAIKELQNEGMTSIVVDLRNNPGGYLNEVIEIADWFVDKGDNILYVDYKSFDDENVFAKRDSLNIPTMVLVNKGSASASEILAGAIKYNGEGTIIGETTYGKGTVQNILRLMGASGMKLTTAEYYAAQMNKVNGVGVEPDVVIEEKTLEVLESVSTFAPMIEEAISHYGVISLNVYGAQQRLKFLGYDVDLTGKYDQKTSKAINSFQELHDLKDKYALYPETLKALTDTVALYLNEDPQLNEAIELIKEAN